MLGLHRAGATPAQPPWDMRLGFDLVQISQVTASLERFGQVYERRLFTAAELAYARGGDGVLAERLAARFAAKEAVMKALGLAEAGIAWTEIEVRKLRERDCDVVLHGRAARFAREMGVQRMLLSLSHDGDYAGAVVTALVSLQAAEEAP